MAYATLWFVYAVIAKSAQDLNADMGEMVVWTRELALGYPKHPPLLAYVLWAWFKVFPFADWAYLLLAVITVSVGIFLAIELCAEWLAKEKLAVVPFLLATIPFYNFLGLKFDQNSALIPLWALAMWAMLRALDTRHLGWAALAGLAAAAAMLVKYWSVFLIAALALAAVMHPRRRDYFRSAAPWVTAGVFLVAVAPHVVWLIRENFPPITWVTTRRVAASFGDTIASMLEALGGTFAYAAVAFALVLLFVRPSPAALRDGFLPQDERRRGGQPVLRAAVRAGRPGADQEHQPALALEYARAQPAARDAARLSIGDGAAGRGAAHRKRRHRADGADRRCLALCRLHAAQDAAWRTTPPMRGC